MPNTGHTFTKVNQQLKRSMGRIYNNIVETVGRTPLVKLNKVTAGLSATILLKCEFFNPLSSVKDRIGMAMIEDAEKRGDPEEGHHYYRAHQRQYRNCPRLCGRRQRLQIDPDDARNDVPRTPHPARHARRESWS